jgi:hypothetical protein
MSLLELCSGSTATVQAAVNTRGAMGGNSPGYVNGATVDFGLQTANTQESRLYDARGETRIYNAFFSSDPALTPNNRLRVTKWMGVTLAKPRFLRVLNCDIEGAPGEAMLWIAACSEVTTENAA